MNRAISVIVVCVVMCPIIMAGCAAPLMQDVGTAGPGVLETSDRAVRAEAVTDDDATLRGAFVEASPGAPV